MVAAEVLAAGVDAVLEAAEAEALAGAAVAVRITGAADSVAHGRAAARGRAAALIIMVAAGFTCQWAWADGAERIMAAGAAAAV